MRPWRLAIQWARGSANFVPGASFHLISSLVSLLPPTIIKCALALSSTCTCPMARAYPSVLLSVYCHCGALLMSSWY
ncbi:hypothetical protein DL93DRAFT_136190 [Clavulina sp. PMI_390]|nr:hypothetical protein DL93DRAFT_136190 [Clavulina sp. PMI_390]